MGRYLALVAMVVMACVRSNTTTCDDGSICRAGTVCHAIGEQFQCVTPDQQAACDGKASGVGCLDDTGTCFEGVCLPSACGNGRLDVHEVCDVGDTTAGDGCSATCRSNERCGNAIVDPVRLVNGAIELNEQCDDGNLLTHDGCASSCRSEFGAWRVVDSAPTSRRATAMVTDTARRRVVVFGGLLATGASLGEPSNDTWILVSDGWIRIRSAVSPSPRGDHAMAFDGHRVVLFGGAAESLIFDDTWEFDRGQWRLVSPAMHPTGRVGHAMAFMPGVGVVLFGGGTGAATTGETWIYENQRWTDVSATAGSPPARSKATLVYDPVRGRLVLATGQGSSGRLDDTWEFDGTTWTEIPLSGAPRVSGGMAAFDATRGHVVLHGGYGSAPGSAVIETQSGSYGWSGTTWEPFVTTILAQHSGAAATDPISGEPCVYGGVNTPAACSPCIDAVEPYVFRLSGPLWSVLGYIAFDGAVGMTAAFDPDRRVIVAAGGATLTAPGAPGITKIWELGEQSFLRPSAFGPTVVHAASAYGRFPNSRGVHVFGGRSGASVSPVMWRWENATWTEVAVAVAPIARQQHAMAFDVKRGVIVVFGGNGAVGANALLRDTWEFDGTSWTDRTLAAGPSARAGHAMAYDPIRQHVVMFGGDDGSSTLDDVWSWDGTTWTERTPAIRPAPRVTSQLAWDAPRKALVLYGALDDTWLWDGAVWTPVPLFDVPVARRSHVLVPSPSGAGVIAFGGVNAGLDSSVVQLVSDEPTAVYTGCHSQFDDDGDGAVGCDDPDCWARCTPWCPPGAPCDTTLPRCGDGACDVPREDCGICPDDCGACP